MGEEFKAWGFSLLEGFGKSYLYFLFPFEGPKRLGLSGIVNSSDYTNPEKAEK